MPGPAGRQSSYAATWHTGATQTTPPEHHRQAIKWRPGEAADKPAALTLQAGIRVRAQSQPSSTDSLSHATSGAFEDCTLRFVQALEYPRAKHFSVDDRWGLYPQTIPSPLPVTALVRRSAPGQRTESPADRNRTAVQSRSHRRLGPRRIPGSRLPPVVRRMHLFNSAPVYLRALRVLMQRERPDARWGLGVRCQPALLTTAMASMAQSLVAALFFPASDGAATGTAARRR